MKFCLNCSELLVKDNINHPTINLNCDHCDVVNEFITGAQLYYPPNDTSRVVEYDEVLNITSFILLTKYITFKTESTVEGFLCYQKYNKLKNFG